jgi:hypothetical protein
MFGLILFRSTIDLFAIDALPKLDSSKVKPMDRTEGTGKRKLLDIDRGLFLVRYSDAEDEKRPPIVRISLDRKSRGDSALILHPDSTTGVLSGPGTALAVRTSAPTQLLVEVIPRDQNGSTTATVKVEALNPGEIAVSPLLTSAIPGSAVDLDGLRIHGHIAGQGDVVVSRDEWLGGPAAPARVEGLQIEWPRKPAGLDIRYAVKFARPQGALSQMTDIGKFAGTRGRALPVTGVVLELSGDDAAGYDLAVEALFLGSPAMRSRGQRVVVSGPTSREPLVGLRVNLEAPENSPTSLPKGKPSNKVRVFRGRQKASQPTA